MIKMLIGATALVLLASVTAFAQAGTVKRFVLIPSRGVTVPITYTSPDAPIATIIHMFGNDGVLGLTPSTPLDPVEALFAERGIAVAVVDVATDQSAGMTRQYRESAEHAADMLAVVRYVRAQADVPVWLSGISNGAISAANGAINLPPDIPLGTGLYSSRTVGLGNVLEMNLESIRRPTLVMANTDDPCPVTPPANAFVIMDRLTSAPVKELVFLSGGNPSSDPCNGGRHVFDGLDVQVFTTIAGFIGRYNSLLIAGTPPVHGFDVDQHGLTGSWYQPATSGQGFEVEVFPDRSPGTGFIQISWFTYDAVVGGAERQRWYTAQGQAVAGQPTIALTIFQNTGGNFNAPPITTAQAVGTATLSFDSCTIGQLVYTFTDGTGRTGTIPLTRLTQNMTCSSATPHPTDADFALSGNWYAPATSGQGFTIEVNPNSSTAFAAWYTYAPNGAGAGAAGQRWYTVQGTFTRNARSIPVQIYETTGGMLDTPTPEGQKTVSVGSGTLAFQSCSAATFAYNFSGGSSSGQSGTITLSRVGPVAPGCTS